MPLDLLPKILRPNSDFFFFSNTEAQRTIYKGSETRRLEAEADKKNHSCVGTIRGSDTPGIFPCPALRVEHVTRGTDPLPRMSSAVNALNSHKFNSKYSQFHSV